MADGTAAGALLAATLAFSASAAQSLTLFRPPPGADVLERLEWFTDVLPSYDGGEQRRALRIAPRRFFEFDILLTARERQTIENQLHGLQAGLWALPVWPDAQALPAALSAGATSIAIDTITRDFRAGGLVGIMDGPLLYEITQAATVADALITLAAPLASAWPAGAIVAPLRPALMADAAGLRRFTGAASYGRVRFEITEACDWPAAVESTYRSAPVLAGPPQWTQDIDAQWQRFIARIDAGTGPVFAEDTAGAPHLMQQHAWLLDGRSQIDALRRWLYARRGRLVAFWMPSFALDFEVVASIDSAATTIDVAHCAYTRSIAQAVGRRDIRIELASGAVHYRRISNSVEVSATVERLTIDSALGVTVAPADVRAISYLSPVRLESDAAEIAWTGTQIAEARLTTRASKNDL